MHGLRKLSLSGSALAKIPPKINSLNNLYYLSVRDSHLVQFSTKILSNLTELDLLLYIQSHLIKVIDDLKKLDILSIALMNEFLELPEEIGILINLDELILHGYVPRKLPNSIVKLVNLKTALLYADFDKLTAEQEIWIKTLKLNGCDTGDDNT
jgi:hypothetical protein